MPPSLFPVFVTSIAVFSVEKWQWHFFILYSISRILPPLILRYATIGIALFLASCISTEKTGVPHQDHLISIAEETGFTPVPVPGGEKNFLHDFLPRGQTLRSTTLLREGDRIAAVFWFKDPLADFHLNSLRKMLYDRFSRGMHSFIDEEIQPEEGAAAIDVFAFTDSVMSSERFLFARIGKTLYEFHVAEEKEQWVQGILLEIARTTTPSSRY
jgi:hypothetical protein